MPPFEPLHPVFRASQPLAQGVCVLEGPLYSYFATSNTAPSRTPRPPTEKPPTISKGASAEATRRSRAIGSKTPMSCSSWRAPTPPRARRPSSAGAREACAPVFFGRGWCGPGRGRRWRSPSAASERSEFSTRTSRPGLAASSITSWPRSCRARKTTVRPPIVHQRPGRQRRFRGGARPHLRGPHQRRFERPLRRARAADDRERVANRAEPPGHRGQLEESLP